MEHYNDVNLAWNLGPLESPEASVQQIQELFEFFAAAASGPTAGRGCLFCNTAVEFGPDDRSGRRFIERYFTRIYSAFLNALKNARGSGEVQGGVDTREEAQSFTASLLGMFVPIRANARPELVEGAATVTIRRLRSICV